MSEEVNLSEESNNPEEVLAQKELLEDVVEIRQMIHQQRFAECNQMLFAIIKNCPNHQPYIQRLVQGLLSTVIASLSLFQRKKMSTETLGFLKLDAKAIKEFEIPEMTPEARTKFVFGAVSELDQLLVDIEMDIRSEQGIFKDLKTQGEEIDIKEVKPTSRNSFPVRRCFPEPRPLEGRAGPGFSPSVSGVGRVSRKDLRQICLFWILE